MKKKVLIFSPYYTPSVKGGGPIVSVRSIVENLSKEIDFYIFTSDRDLGDKHPFEGIEHNKWMSVGGAKVWYTNREKINYNEIKKIMKSKKFDCFYLNSFFNYYFSILPLLIKNIKREIKTDIILAPRGEFSQGALQLKKTKKNIYIQFFKIFGFQNKLKWHATAETEKKDINDIFGDKVSINIASNLTANYADLEYTKNIKKNKNELSIVFISRIHPKKNLIMALQVLKELKGEILFSIYGPIEDREYWYQCQKLIKKMPSNIKVVYEGILQHNEIIPTFRKYHIFFFPTLGENFGHVISEAMIGGCPVLISDQTPWRNLERENVGWDLPLGETKKFQKIIEYFIEMDVNTYQVISQNAFKYGKNMTTNEHNIQTTYKLFE